MKYCTKCVLPDTHETISFDSEGVCSVCRQAEIKHKEINWDERKHMLNDIADKYRGKATYDCIVPFSGGKDSTFQLWYVVTQLKLKPLVVRFNHFGYRPLVEKNNRRVLKQLGVDFLDFTPNWNVVKLLMLESLKQRGDFCWHCHCGVFAHTMQLSVKFKIPLVIWGEASSEYRSYKSAKEIEMLNKDTFDKMINLGINADEMYEALKDKLDKRDLEQYFFPTLEELNSISSNPIYLGNYIKWNTKDNVEIIKKELGWKGQPVEGIPPEYDYEKIECQWQGIRDYCKYIKRGHGRTNHLACIDIRNGVMDRETGMKLALKYDGKRPASLDRFLETIGITEDEFIDILRKNEVSDWGFDKTKIPNGEPLEDMIYWD